MKKRQKKWMFNQQLYIWYKIMLIYVHSISHLKSPEIISRIFDKYKHLHSHLIRVVLDIQHLAFGSSWYIQYNMAAHIVNSTCGNAGEVQSVC